MNKQDTIQSGTGLDCYFAKSRSSKYVLPGLCGMQQPWVSGNNLATFRKRHDDLNRAIDFLRAYLVTSWLSYVGRFD